MGIGAWFGFGSRAPTPPQVSTPRAPTADDLVAAVDAVERQARDGKVPPMVQSRLGRVTRVVRDTVPRLDSLGAGSPSAYNVMATATNYLPDAIGGYLRLPRQWADSRPVDRGRTPLMILIDQLDLLGATMDRVFDAVCNADAQALIVHGRFLEEKFGAAAGGGGLRLDPSPSSSPPSDPTGGVVPLSPPSGRSGP
ncbi:MAG: hypothetical protein M3Y71_01365 [Actinomycetota bacterium]|nr:hypothetical protein [Actinomycetota bacterium]